MKRFTLPSFFIVIIILFSILNLFAQENRNMALLSRWASGAITDIAIEDNYLYLINKSSLQIVDITTPDNPQLISSTNFDLTASGNRPLINIHDHYIFALNYEKLDVIDISNPSSPIHKATCQFAGHHMVIQDNYAYIAADGLIILDISDPENITQVGSIEPDVSVCYWIDVQGNYAYLAEHDGFHVFDVTKPTDPVEIASFGVADGYDHVFTLAVEGNYAYVFITADLILKVLDISSPSNPKEVANYKVTEDYLEWGAIHNCDLNYPYLYITGNSYQFLMLDVSDPANPKEAGNYKMDTYPDAVVAQDDLAFVYGDDSYLYIFRNLLIAETKIDESLYLSKTFPVCQNYPNPFNSATKIFFNLSSSQHIEINLYNMSGQLIEKIYKGNLLKGDQQINYRPRFLSSGLYFYKITAENDFQIGRMLYLK